MINTANAYLDLLFLIILISIFFMIRGRSHDTIINKLIKKISFFNEFRARIYEYIGFLTIIKLNS
jgi:hypothetical protein